ncbi:hypothetical protein VFDL14_01595 [Vibrio fortis]|uniref:Uncharacterized protein n=1 Tax=Vibrio fortis TaxID=212667 RepID=A0A066ULP4_9VIBR|nr:hypothetical protein [Vibrio fortis]KDN27990.1 hypothetical protein VFDL14_01595 [Vibrio fortis]
MLHEFVSHGEKLKVTNAGWVNSARAVYVTFTGNDGWGVSITIPESKLSEFLDDPIAQYAFIWKAKRYLGMEEPSCNTQQ